MSLAALREATGGTSGSITTGDPPGHKTSGSPTQDVLSSIPKSSIPGSIDQTTPKGTGVFMPMVGRSSSNSRSKLQRRRNASTSCLLVNSPDSRNRQPRRNISSASLAAAPAGQQNSSSLRAGLPSSQGPLPSSGLCNPSTTVMVPTSGSHAPTVRGPCTPFLGAQPQLQQQQQPLQPQQQLSPFALVSNAPCGWPIPALDGSLASTCNSSSMQGCLSVPVVSTHMYVQGSGCMAHAAVQGPSTMQQQPSSGFLQVGGPCGPHMQPVRQPPADMQHPVLAMSCQHDPVVRPGSAAPMSDSILAYPGSAMPVAGGHMGGFMSGSNAVLLSAPQVSSCDSLLSQWASLGLSEQELLTALTCEPSRETALEVQQDVIEQNINKLSVIKRLLQLKQQHKTQQQLLQLQQQQQELLLQQQLLSTNSVTANGNHSMDSMQQLHQDLVQLLHMHGGSGSSGGSLTANSSLQTAGHASAPQIITVGSALPVSGAGNPMAPAFSPGLLQQHLQHNPSTLQGADAPTLSSLLQQRLSFRQHEQAQQQARQASAPCNVLGERLPATWHSAHSIVNPSQALVLQGWGQL